MYIDIQKAIRKLTVWKAFFAEFCEYANDLSEEVFVQKIEC